MWPLTSTRVSKYLLDYYGIILDEGEKEEVQKKIEMYPQVEGMEYFIELYLHEDI